MADNWSDLDDWIDEIEDDLQYIKTSTAKAMMKSVTQPTQNKKKGGQQEEGKTPVDTGNLMANTEVTLNSPSDGTNERSDKTGYSTLAAGYLVINRSTLWDTIYIQNNTPYNPKAEFLGWKFTAPYKFFRTSINDAFEHTQNLK